MAKKSKLQTKAGRDALDKDLAEIERVLAFMHRHGLEELAYERSGVHIHLRKAATHSEAGNRPISSADIGGASALVTGHPAAPAATDPSARAHAAEAGPAAGAHVIKSPIVGTYYAAPGPDADPFVKVGAKVDFGQVLCIIEAMKLMNEIESDVAGEIVQVFVENGQPVEYGEPLFGIRPHGKK